MIAGVLFTVHNLVGNNKLLDLAVISYMSALPHLVCRLFSKKRKAVLMFLQPTLCIVLYPFWCIWFWHLLFHKYKKPIGVYSVSTANIFPRRFFYFSSIVQLFLGYFFAIPEFYLFNFSNPNKFNREIAVAILEEAGLKVDSTENGWLYSYQTYPGT